MDASDNLLEGTFLGSKWFNPDYLFNQGVILVEKALGWNIDGEQILDFYHSILFFFALFFLTIISYSMVRLLEIRRKEHKHLKHEIAEYAHHQAERAKKATETDAVSKNPQWIKTLNYLFSQHASDWKLAVIEADSMLDALMSQLGFKGESLGEKLKSATHEKFHSLPAAWEAHTVRNRIAHEGAAFDLSQREAKRIIAVYEHIFRDFGYI